MSQNHEMTPNERAGGKGGIPFLFHVERARPALPHLAFGGLANLPMKKNRKKAATYRFNGHPYFDAGSIHSVEIAELEARIKQFESKLADASNPDDKKWT